MNDSCGNCGNWQHLCKSKKDKISMIVINGWCKIYKVMTTNQGWCKTHTEYTEDKG